MSVRMQHLGSHWPDLNEIWYLNIFRKYVEKIQVLLKYDLSRWMLLRMRNVSDKNCRENQNTDIKTHCMFTNFFSRKSWRLWINVERHRRAGQATDNNTAHAHCMLDSQGHKHILIAFPWQLWLHERASMLRYTYLACLVECSACISISESMLAFFCRRCYILCRINVMNTSRHSVKCVLLRTKSN
jgi:hypothetical protein